MAESSFPWAVVVAGDRTVTAAHQKQLNSDYGFEGVIGGLAPTKSGTTVLIAAGSAVLQGVNYVNSAQITVTPAAGTRKDYVVLRYTAADRDIVCENLEGTSEVFPTLTHTPAVYELAIASIDNSGGLFTVLDTRDASGLCRTYFPTAHLVGAAGEIAFATGWANWGAGANPGRFYREPSGRISLFGQLAKVGGTTTILTLPAGFRAAYPGSHTTMADGVAVLVSWDTAGVVSLLGAGTNIGYVLLDGISFYAA